MKLWRRAGLEQRPQFVLPGATVHQTTYERHVFRLRITDANTGRWIRDFEVDGGADIDLCPCNY
jgi:hypothetical protein